MKKKILLIPLALLLAISLVAGGCVHPGPYFPIENQFGQPVTIYFNGVKVGKIQPNATKTFYPNEVLTTTSSDLLLEAKSDSGMLLYSREFTWSQLTGVIESLHGRSYKIGSEVLSVEINSPEDGAKLSTNLLKVTGTVSDAQAVVEISETRARVGKDGTFYAYVELSEGMNMDMPAGSGADTRWVCAVYRYLHSF